MTETNEVLTAAATGDEELRRQLAELEDVAALFRASFEQSPVAQTIVDSEFGRYLDVNEAFATLAAIPRSEAIGSNAARLGLVVDVEQRSRMIERIRRGETIEADSVSMRRRDGECRQLAVSARALRFRNREALHFVFEDVTEKERARKATEESQARLELALRSGRLGVWDWNLRTNEVTWNDEMFELFGVPKGASPLPGDAWERWVHPDDRDRMRREVRAALEGEGILDTEWRLVRTDGAVRDLRADVLVVRDQTGNPVRLLGVNRDISAQKGAERALAEETRARIANLLSTGPTELETLQRTRDGNLRNTLVTARIVDVEGKSFCQCVWRDVTERKRMEEELQESEARLRDVVFSAGDWVWEIDVAGRLVFGMSREAKVGGYSIDELRGKSAFDFMPPAEAERVRAIFADIVRRKAPIRDLENWIVRKDGQRACIVTNGVPLVDSDGNLRGYRGVDRDITERKRIEAALQESQARFRAIFSDSPISMAIVRMDGTIEYINQQAIETFGYRPEEIPTMEQWWKLAYPDEARRAEAIGIHTGLVDKAISEGGKIERREYRVTCKDGTVKTMLVFGVPVADRIFLMFEDVTERRAAEEALRENRRELATWHDLVTHDLGNFSMTLLGMVEQLLDDEIEPDPSRRREMLQRVFRQGFEMQRLAENAKLLARLRAGVMTGSDADADLAATIDEAITTLRAVHFDRRSDIRVACPAGVRVRGVPFLVNIFLNLVDNALRHGGKRSPAEVEIRAGWIPGDSGRIAVTVRGGLPPPDELIPSLFDRYMRGPRSNGTGLGLAVVRELVVHAGGDVAARAVRDDAGPVFEIRLVLPTA